MRIIIILITILSLNTMQSQHLEKHQWKNRVLLIISDNEASDNYKNQILKLAAAQDELIERKVLVYNVLPKKYKVSTNASNWIAASFLFNSFMDTNDAFAVILIGLDGTVKLKKEGLLTTKTLFDLIDSMPMRQAEMRKN
ncbi:DUF4174 domain-containing protein [Lacinutrix sp. Hel_I_90]|uniref:DUF4174 domain-containing protein n=1 Tax=Lacinutrix sp. Hel_I_90 TaxID=1249999 RepID=UPI0005C881EC|nr:DUF4174 domain-containing protein [Lacinutrix sp. Hel_I_90]